MWFLALLGVSGCLRSVGPETYTPDTAFETGLSVDGNADAIFAMKHVFAVLQTDPSPFGSGEESMAVTSIMRVAWTQDGTAVAWSETLCGLSSNMVFGTTTSYPEAFVSSMPRRTRSAMLSGENTGATLTAGPFYDVVGAELEDPATDALPTEAGDSRVTDPDGDGNPGVTVDVDQSILGRGSVYVAQRLDQSMEGTLISEDRIEGYVTGQREQTILGATASWLETEVQERPDPDPNHSFFIMQRVDSSTSCADILASQAELFDN